MTMIYKSKFEIAPSEMITAVLVDLRNFTQNLNASKSDEHGVSLFGKFLSELYAIFVDTCLHAFDARDRSAKYFHLSSTGDGVLIIFSGSAHARRGFLAAILLHHVLQRECETYNSIQSENTQEKLSFGIGVDSGNVHRITVHPPDDTHCPGIDTYIGPCINVAARAEALTKTYYRAHTIVAQSTVEDLSTEIFGKSYKNLIKTSLNPAVEDAERLALQDEMKVLNRNLCLAFLYYHRLRGVDNPVALYRLVDYAVHPGNPRFDALVRRLTDSDAHLEDVLSLLDRYTAPDFDRFWGGVRKTMD